MTDKREEELKHIFATLSGREKAWIFKYLVSEELSIARRNKTDVPLDGLTRHLSGPEQAYLMFQCSDIETKTFTFAENDNNRHLIIPDYKKWLDKLQKKANDVLKVDTTGFYKTLMELRKENEKAKVEVVNGDIKLYLN